MAFPNIVETTAVIHQDVAEDRHAGDPPADITPPAALRRL
jgi:hypothetical protein